MGNGFSDCLPDMSYDPANITIRNYTVHIKWAQELMVLFIVSNVLTNTSMQLRELKFSKMTSMGHNTKPKCIGSYNMKIF